MKNYSELSLKEMSSVVGGATTPPKGAFPNPSGLPYGYGWLYGGPGGGYYQSQGGCYGRDKQAYYIGGGVWMCKKF